MVNTEAYHYGSQRSAIRELFEYGKRKSAELGKDKVFDFSLGNPSVPAPIAVQNAFEAVLRETDPVALHGYTSAQGSLETRAAIASVMTERSGMTVRPENLYLTCGAAASLTACFGALTLDETSEFLAVAPFFPEYKVFAESLGGKLRVVPLDESAFQINFEALEAMLTEHTQGVIINSPNNPSGVIYSEETLRTLSEILTRKSAEYGHPIYLISDEPYRELVYTDTVPPFLPKIYKDTLICYSYSKSFSLPGERIGYVCIPDCVTDAEEVYAAVAGAARRFGYVCAPSLLQRVVEKCADILPDLTVYKRNRDLLYGALTEMGYECVNPDGAFYLFVRSPKGDGAAFSARAKEKNLLVVPGESFGAKDYVRISYCVDTDMIERSLPTFRELIGEYKSVPKEQRELLKAIEYFEEGKRYVECEGVNSVLVSCYSKGFNALEKLIEQEKGKVCEKCKIIMLINYEELADIYFSKDKKQAALGWYDKAILLCETLEKEESNEVIKSLYGLEANRILMKMLYCSNDIKSMQKLVDVTNEQIKGVLKKATEHFKGDVPKAQDRVNQAIRIMFLSRKEHIFDYDLGGNIKLSDEF